MNTLETERQEEIREYVFLDHCGMESSGTGVLQTIDLFDPEFLKVVNRFKKLLHQTPAREILEQHENITYEEFMERWSEASGRRWRKRKDKDDGLKYQFFS
jgi:hypothetical protein